MRMFYEKAIVQQNCRFIWKTLGQAYLPGQDLISNSNKVQQQQPISCVACLCVEEEWNENSDERR